MNSRGFQISFAWLFGIIVGAFILALAIFAATRVINVGQAEIGAETQKELGVLLNPLETGFEEAQVSRISLPTNTRIYNNCVDEGTFGKQKIQIVQESFGRWPEPGANTSFENKYIFSENIIEGKEFIIFSKPFEFPFKVSDVIYIIPVSRSYCFVNPSTDIENEISNLNQPSLFVSESIENCEEGSIAVCFDSEDECDILITGENSGEVTRNGEVVYYEDALMYAAIFSNKEVYECQVKRLVKRTTELANIYKTKEDLTSKQGCNSNLNSLLSTLISTLNSFNNSDSLNTNLISLVEEIKQSNRNSYCKLW